MANLLLFFSSLTVFLKALDWWLGPEQKEILRRHLERLISDEVKSGSMIVKAPLEICSRIFNYIFGNNSLVKRSLFRGFIFSLLLLLACLAAAGLKTDTLFGISQTPWAAYDDDVEQYYKITVLNGDRLIKDTDQKKRADIKAADDKILGVIVIAKQPQWKWIYTILLLLFVPLLNAVALTASFAFSRVVVRDLLNTDSPSLIAGALLLGLFVSIVIANISVFLLGVLTNPALLGLFALGGASVAPMNLLGVGLAIGFNALLWVTTSTWIKAIAFCAVVPIVVFILMAGVAALLYPLKSQIGSFIHNLVRKALCSDRGPIYFFCSGVSVLSAAILILNKYVS